MTHVRIGRVVAAAAAGAVIGVLVGVIVYAVFAGLLPFWLIITINVAVGFPIGAGVARLTWGWCSQTPRPQPPVQWTEDRL